MWNQQVLFISKKKRIPLDIKRWRGCISCTALGVSKPFPGNLSAKISTNCKHKTVTKRKCSMMHELCISRWTAARLLAAFKRQRVVFNEQVASLREKLGCFLESICVSFPFPPPLCTFQFPLNKCTQTLHSKSAFDFYFMRYSNTHTELLPPVIVKVSYHLEGKYHFLVFLNRLFCWDAPGPRFSDCVWVKRVWARQLPASSIIMLFSN